MMHRTDIERYPGTPTELASELGDLRYDALAVFLRALAAKMASDGDADTGRGRVRLAAQLRSAAVEVASAADAVERAWQICAPHV